MTSYVCVSGPCRGTRITQMRGMQVTKHGATVCVVSNGWIYKANGIVRADGSIELIYECEAK